MKHEKDTILIVDDSRTILFVIKGILEPKYNIRLAKSGEEALELIKNENIDLILLDLLMPQMDGKETFHKFKEQDKNFNVPVIFLTAQQNEEIEYECLQMGAQDFIVKPIFPSILRKRIDRVLTLNKYEKFLEKKVEEKTLEIESLVLQSISAIANAIDAKDEETNGHSKRVAVYSREIAMRMGFSNKEIAHLYQMALLHDVGKIGISDNILKKQGRLESDEYEMIKSHTTRGAEILSAITSIPNLSDGAKYHHERYDGSGYPVGLKGEEIPIVARIIAVADVFDALSSKRCYKESMDKSLVIEEMKKGSGTSFDPKILNIFLEYMNDINESNGKNE